jgi:hypothetical protein
MASYESRINSYKGPTIEEVESEMRGDVIKAANEYIVGNKRAFEVLVMANDFSGTADEDLLLYAHIAAGPQTKAYELFMQRIMPHQIVEREYERR